MSVCVDWNYRGLTDVVIDRHSHNDRLGVTLAKRFPPYVYSTRRNAKFVHRIHHVELHWWGLINHREVAWLYRPILIAETMCRQSRRFDAKAIRACLTPPPEIPLCLRCQEEAAH
jgi:hypothetical protein